jgi:beta-phosphoglucomutase-like phosphatase (HAD superfamily)
LVIEDAPAGIRSAHAGGMKVIALSSTYPASALGEADSIIDKLSRLRVYSARAGSLLEVNIE